MAEAADTASLITSITLLIDSATRVTSRLQKFASKTADVPEFFSALERALPLAVSALQHVSSYAQAARLPNGLTTSLLSLAENTTADIWLLEICLTQVAPHTDSVHDQGVVKALQSPLDDDNVRTLVKKVKQDLDTLLLYQTTHHIDSGNETLDMLTDSQLVPAQGSLITIFPNVNVRDHANVQLGDVYHVHQRQEPEEIQSYGLCWGAAPLIDADHFIGRATEVNQIKRILQPGEGTSEQRRVVLGGLGGIGKTQLAIAYTRQNQYHYTSTF